MDGQIHSLFNTQSFFILQGLMADLVLNEKLKAFLKHLNLLSSWQDLSMFLLPTEHWQQISDCVLCLSYWVWRGSIKLTAWLLYMCQAPFYSRISNEATSWLTSRDYSTQHSRLRQLHHVRQVRTEMQVSNCVIKSALFPISTIAKLMSVLSKHLKISVAPLTMHGPGWNEYFKCDLLQ